MRNCATKLKVLIKMRTFIPLHKMGGSKWGFEPRKLTAVYKYSCLGESCNVLSNFSSFIHSVHSDNSCNSPLLLYTFNQHFMLVSANLDNH